MTETRGAEAELTISRTFDAPRALVYKAWTEAERLAEWWGPKGFTMGIHKLDLRPGGLFHYSMKTPDGQEMWGRFVYGEVAPPEKLVFINAFADEAGNVVRNPWNASWPLEVMNELTLSEAEGKTTVTLRGWPHQATDEERRTFAENVKNVQGGFKGTLDQLEAYLAKA